MDGTFEKVANQVIGLILPIVAILILFTGISTIIYGFYILNQKSKRKGLRYIGTDLGIIEFDIILGVLFLLSNDRTNFHKTDNETMFIVIVVILLLIIPVIIFIQQIRRKIKLGLRKERGELHVEFKMDIIVKENF